MQLCGLITVATIEVNVAETFGSMILKQKTHPQQMGVG